MKKIVVGQCTGERERGGERERERGEGVKEKGEMKREERRKRETK